jgi:hypothetical protein
MFSSDSEEPAIFIIRAEECSMYEINGMDVRKRGTRMRPLGEPVGIRRAG